MYLKNDSGDISSISDVSREEFNALVTNIDNNYWKHTINIPSTYTLQDIVDNIQDRQIVSVWINTDTQYGKDVQAAVYTDTGIPVNYIYGICEFRKYVTSTSITFYSYYSHFRFLCQHTKINSMGWSRWAIDGLGVDYQNISTFLGRHISPVSGCMNRVMRDGMTVTLNAYLSIGAGVEQNATIMTLPSNFAPDSAVIAGMAFSDDGQIYPFGISMNGTVVANKAIPVSKNIRIACSWSRAKL